MKFRDLALSMALDYFVTNLEIDKLDADEHTFQIESQIISMGPHGTATFITSLGFIIQRFRNLLEEWDKDNEKCIVNFCSTIRRVKVDDN